jgi:hypothetical protein
MTRYFTPRRRVFFINFKTHFHFQQALITSLPLSDLGSAEDFY